MRLADLAIPVVLTALVPGCSKGTRATTDSNVPSSASQGSPSASAPAAPSTEKTSDPASEAYPDPESPGSPLSFADQVKIAGLPMPKDCVVDGPLWPESTAGIGGGCSKEEVVGCFEFAQVLYEWGRWACARQYHLKGCQLAPHMTDPPPGGGDYALIGFPQCPVAKDKDGRLAWKDKELKDPTKKSCFVDHVTSACEKLAKESKDEIEKSRLLQVASSFAHR
jgi:hypothetical protein